MSQTGKTGSLISWYNRVSLGWGKDNKKLINNQENVRM
jgi:hypothetical protein